MDLKSSSTSSSPTTTKTNTNDQQQQKLNLTQLSLSLTQNPTEAIINELMLFYNVLLHKSICETVYISPKMKTFVEIYGLTMPICTNYNIVMYIEACTKKIVSLLIAGFLQGFTIKFYNCEKNVVQKYIANVTTNCSKGLECIITPDCGLNSRKENANIIRNFQHDARIILSEANQSSTDQNLLMLITEMRVLIAVNPEYVKNFKTAKVPLTLPDDKDSFIFPWSEPTTPSDIIHPKERAKPEICLKRWRMFSAKSRQGLRIGEMVMEVSNVYYHPPGGYLECSSKYMYTHVIQQCHFERFQNGFKSSEGASINGTKNPNSSVSSEKMSQNKKTKLKRISPKTAKRMVDLKTQGAILGAVYRKEKLNRK